MVGKRENLACIISRLRWNMAVDLSNERNQRNVGAQRDPHVFEDDPTNGPEITITSADILPIQICLTFHTTSSAVGEWILMQTG